MISRGVPAGAKKPTQRNTSKPGYPAATPVRTLKSSPARCDGVPGPGEANVIRPGRCFASACAVVDDQVLDFRFIAFLLICVET